MNRYCFRGKFDVYVLVPVLLEIGVLQMRAWRHVPKPWLERFAVVVWKFFTHAVKWCFGESARTSPMHLANVEDINGGWDSQLSGEYVRNMLFKLQHCCA